MDVSIIIPYYNAGLYLQDALGSLKTFKDNPDVEIIIVNDGSTDPESIAFLETIKDDVYIIINQQNAGAAAARNTGLKASIGDYILFLDSDNKLRDVFIDKGLGILRNEEVDIVYGKAS